MTTLHKEPLFVVCLKKDMCTRKRNRRLVPGPISFKKNHILKFTYVKKEVLRNGLSPRFTIWLHRYYYTTIRYLFDFEPLFFDNVSTPCLGTQGSAKHISGGIYPAAEKFTSQKLYPMCRHFNLYQFLQNGCPQVTTEYFARCIHCKMYIVYCI